MAIPCPVDPIILSQSIQNTNMLSVGRVQSTMMQVTGLISKFVIANIYTILIIIGMVIVAFAELCWDCELN